MIFDSSVEAISHKWKTSVPEDDSSFLLRAQPIPLNVVTTYRDQRSNSLSYKKFVGYYDEPILHPLTKTDKGGRLRRECFKRYYPNDRTASVTFIQHDRRVDYRNKEARNSCISLDDIDILSRPKEFERHPCNKKSRKGTERPVSTLLSNTILASNLMDSADFTDIARSGKASDFLYRMNLFEEPAIDLSGKEIIIQDSTAIGCHQADASSLELSDASLSISLTIDSCGEIGDFFVKCDCHHSPLVFMKVTKNTKDESSTEKKSMSVYIAFKTSLVRAALLIC